MSKFISNPVALHVAMEILPEKYSQQNIHELPCFASG